MPQLCRGVVLTVECYPCPHGPVSHPSHRPRAVIDWNEYAALRAELRELKAEAAAAKGSKAGQRVSCQDAAGG